MYSAMPEGGIWAIPEGFDAFISPIIHWSRSLLIHKCFVNLATVVMLLSTFTEYPQSLSS